MNNNIVLNKVGGFFKSNQEFGIILLVICVLAMMVIPLPTELLDVIIATNISFSIIVMMVVVYIGSPAQLTSFPSILLVLALLRIGITISTSRLILLNTNAGHIVETFGTFVVGGNLVVGLIIFLIITIINFIVITKGSERVAEVTARFSLDAMPGKQMSIDSDLRANAITAEQANERRQNLALESQLYGAMDGSMKFVKGDAIASIVDILINLVGGLIVGMMQHGMAFSDAIQTYSILTVGDGLVQQLPALIVSITAGLLVTRVNDDNNKQNLGKLIFQQLSLTPKALVAASVLMLIFSAIPGMPSMVFIAIVVILLGIAGLLYLKAKKSAVPKEESGLVESVEPTNSNDIVSWKLAPLMLQGSNNLKNGKYVNIFKQAISQVQQQVLLDIGVRIPAIALRYTDLPDNQYQLLLYEVPTTVGIIYPEHILALEQDVEMLRGFCKEQPIANMASIGLSTNGFWIDKSYATQCDEFGVKYLDNETFLNLNLSCTIKQHTLEFIGIQETKTLLDSMQEYQELIRELLRMAPLNKISEVLQRLVKEDISIRNFKVILDSMLEWMQREKEITIIVEHIRKSLGRYIAHKFSKGTKLIPCFIMNQDLEDVIRNSIRFGDTGSYLSIDAKVTQALIKEVQHLYKENNCSRLQVPVAIITHMDVRRYVRSIIEHQLPFLPVLSYEELEGLAEFQGLGVIEISLDLSFADYE